MDIPREQMKKGLKIAGIVFVVVAIFSVFSTGLGPIARRAVTNPGSSGALPHAPLSAPGAGFDLGNPLSGLFEAGERRSSESVAPGTTHAASPAEGELTVRKIVKNGSISMLVHDVPTSARDIQGIAERLGGFVANSSIGAPGRTPVRPGGAVSKITSGSVTIRVPSDRFDAAMTDVKALAAEVSQESVSAQDVTEKFVDMEGRLKNLRAEEERYLDILKRADTVTETLSVVKYVTETRGKIEQLEGQMKYLANQVDMSSVSASLTAEADVEVFGIRWRPLTVIKQSFQDGLKALADYFDWLIAVLFMLPALLLRILTGVVVIVAGWKAFVWVRNRFLRKQA